MKAVTPLSAGVSDGQGKLIKSMNDRDELLNINSFSLQVAISMGPWSSPEMS